jgi:hypothetical protein
LRQRAKEIRTKGKGGAALITAIVFVFFLTLFGLAYYRLGETDLDLFGYDKKLSKALYASEAGIEKVRWMLRESHQISWVNPFSTNYDGAAEANALAIANPTSGDFFPGEADKPYFRVAMIQKASKLEPAEPENKVRVRVLGSMDVDGDGVAGLTTTEDGFTFDPDDVNRRFEAYIGLPGTLGERIGGKGISAAAKAFYAGGVEVSLFPESREFKTPDGDSLRDRNGDLRFLYLSPKTTYGAWDQWRFIFSDPAPTVSNGEIDKIELPTGIFDESGAYVDEDNNGIPDYFQDLNLRTFASTPPDFKDSNDPTAGAEGRSVIYVDGNIVIDGVDFGYLNDQGDVKFCNWEKRDLTFIANGDITVKRVDCGNVGRLVLVAKNILLEGDYNTKVNGIAIAFNDITLDGKPVSGSGCDYKILTNPDSSRPVKYTAYFLGSMVAGNHVVLKDDGWTVIYDENVINGNMYSTALLKPTLTYERVEAEDFTTNNNWHTAGADELKCMQEDYIQEDIDNGRADYGDVGADGVPELMKMYQKPIWHSGDDNHDFPITDWVYCDFTDAGNVFEDSDIRIGRQNWDNYTTLHFYMALDNWVKIFGSKSTLRESSFRLRLQDAGGNWISLPLSYPSNNWVVEPGKVHWIFVRVTPQLFDPLSNFDMRNVVRIEFYSNDILVSWYINDFDREWIRYDKNTGSGYGLDGYYYYMKFNPADPLNPIKYPVRFKSPDLNGRRQLSYEDPPYTTPGTGTLDDIQWNLDPNTSTLENMYFEDTLDPLKSALNSVLKIDRIELPGKPAANTYLEYGLPQSLRLDVTNWREL